ncbi:MAG TPA: hypothetical protein VFQ21_11385 [Gemmatimonadota bacterium]|nr:hypothetical protein [Gemmatimonadota bacterium]
MAASRRARTAVTLALAALALECGESRSGSEEPAPRPLGEAADLSGAGVPSAQEQARAIAGNPRLLLFDLQTALEGVFQTRGAYPTSDEFQATESWGLQRDALDAAFDSWSYESDGQTYELDGEAGGREFGIRSPQ